jgi:hypothetical protein
MNSQLGRASKFSAAFVEIAAGSDSHEQGFQGTLSWSWNSYGGHAKARNECQDCLRHRLVLEPHPDNWRRPALK